MKAILDKVTNWAKRTFFTVHYVHTYKDEKLEYQIVSEVVTDKVVIEKANRILSDVAA